MKASEAQLFVVLRNAPQFVIPVYQRVYSWTRIQCRQLWDDLIRAGSSESITSHFVGSIVYVSEGLHQASNSSPLLVIDGQQRLTTVTILIAALAKALGDSEPLDGFSRIKLESYYLINPLESGEKRFKLLLSEGDRTTLKSVVSDVPRPASPSFRVLDNLQLFNELISARSGELTAVCRGLAKLTVVDISLDRVHDNPQLIFESMNSTGLDLSQADLIRNYGNYIFDTQG